MSDLRIQTEVFGVPVIITPTVTYRTQEREVEAWLAQLPAPGAMTPAQLDALHRLEVHEDGLYRLWNAGAASAHVGNAEMAHIGGLVFSIASAVNKVFTFLSKSLVGKLVTKLNAYVISKVVGMWLIALEWSSAALRDDATRQDLQVTTKLAGEGFQAAMENSLKTTNFAKSFTWDFFTGLVESLLIVPLNQHTGKSFVENTKQEVTAGLSLARAASTAGVDKSWVDQEALRVTREADQLVGPIEDKAEALQREGKKLEGWHFGLGFSSEFVAAFSTVLALPPSGVGNVAGVIGHLISIGLKVIDGIMSSVLAVNAYAAWDSARQVALGLDERVFFRPTTQLLDPVLPESVQPLMSMRTYGMRSPGLATASRPEASAKNTLAPEAEVLLARVNTRVTIYNELVTQLADAVQADNPSAAERIADRLLDADMDLSAEFRTARQPVLVAASDLIPKGDEEFSKAYSALGRTAAAFDGEGAILYMYLLGWLAEPKSSEAKRLLTEQAGVVVNRTLAHEAALQRALPFARDAVGTPNAVVTRCLVPSALSVGSRASLEVEITNSGNQEASNVVVLFDPGQNAQAASGREQRLGSLKVGETQRVSFDFTPAATFGLLSVTSKADNGRGSFVVAPFSAASVTAPTAAGSGSGIGLVLGLAGLVGGLMVVVTVARRNRLRASAARGATARLIGTAGQGVFTVWNGTVLGRDPGCALQLADPYVSRRHAQFRYARGTWYIQDLGSKAGTHVNGSPVTAAALRDGDRVRVGETEFQFRSGG